MRPSRLTIAGIVAVTVFAPLAARADTRVVTSSESHNTTVRSGDSHMENNNSYTTGSASADNSDLEIGTAGATTNGGTVGTAQDGGNVTSVIDNGSATTGDEVSGTALGSVSPAGGNGADLILAPQSADGGQTTVIDGLFIGLPVSSGSSVA